MWSFESFSDVNWDHVLRVKISKDDTGQTPFNIAAELPGINISPFAPQIKGE